MHLTIACEISFTAVQELELLSLSKHTYLILAMRVDLDCQITFLLNIFVNFFFKAKMLAISSDTHQLHYNPKHHFI